MRRILCTVILAVFLCASLLAFSSKSVGLTNSDVEAFINNFSEIDVILDEKLDVETNANLETLTVKEIMALIPDSANRNATKELNKLGISGTNAVEKVFAITYGVAYNYIESFYALMALLSDDTDDDMAEFEATLAAYEASFSEADYNIIKNNIDELYNVLGFNSDGGYSDSSWDDYDWGDYDYDWDDDYDWGDYDWDDYDYSYNWGDEDTGYVWGDDDYEYGWDDYDWSDYDYDWDDDYEYYTEEEELDSEAGMKFLKELIPSLSAKSGSADFLYNILKPGTYTKVQETDETCFMFEKEWAGSKHPTITVSEFCISMSYKDPNDPDADWDDEVYKYFYIDGTTELYKATIRGTVYYERVFKTKQYGTIRIWVDTTDLGEGEDLYYSSSYAVLSIGDYFIAGRAFVAAG